MVATPGSILHIGSGAGQNHFSVQFARSGDDEIVELKQAKIAAGAHEKPFFAPTDDGAAVRFWVQVDAPTTSRRTKYPRSELREFAANGVDRMEFKTRTGTHWLEGSSRIIHLPPKKPEVVVAQLHGGKDVDDLVQIRTNRVSATGAVELGCKYVDKNEVERFVSFDPDYDVGAEFAWRIALMDGDLAVYIEDMTTPLVIAEDMRQSTKAYFKAGCYAQSNHHVEGTDDEFFAVELRNLALGHGRPEVDDRDGRAPQPRARATVVNWTGVSVGDRMRYTVESLVNTYGYPVNAAAGIVGNLFAESAIIPNRIEGSAVATPMRARDFAGRLTTFTATQIKDRDFNARRGPKLAGVGLAQWTFRTRRAGLFRHAFNGAVLGANVLFDMDAQLDYLEFELGRDFVALRKLLRKPDVALHKASDEVVYQFERPGAILDSNGNVRPRDHERVQAVFRQRREHAEQALEAFAQRVMGEPPQGEIQSDVFRNATPADWTPDEDIADMARQGQVVLHERSM